MNFPSSKSINAMIDNLITIIGYLVIVLISLVTIVMIWNYFAYFFVGLLAVCFIIAMVLLLSELGNESNGDLDEYFMSKDY